MWMDSRRADGGPWTGPLNVRSWQHSRVCQSENAACKVLSVGQAVALHEPIKFGAGAGSSRVDCVP